MEGGFQKKLKSEVVDAGLCSGCGTCGGVCMQYCICFAPESSYAPNFDPQKCTDCGLCYKACPSTSFQFRSLKNEQTQWEDKLGPYLSFVNSNATNAELRKNGASGGTVSAIFQYLLDKKLVDRVLCVQKEGAQFQVCLTNDVNVLSKTQGSKYIPVPLNTAISDILKNKWTVAMVGTSCQLQGVEKVCRMLPKLKRLIKYRIGIFCGFVQDRECFPAVRNYLGAQDPAWRFEGWRCGDYPGYVRFVHENTGEIRQLLIYDALCLLVPFYSLNKCFLCPDGTNMTADFSFGDIHSRGSNQNCGIIRTPEGAALLEQMVRDGYLEMETISYEQAMKSTVGSVSYMKGMRSLLNIHTNKKANPRYDMQFDKSKYKKLLIIQNRIQIGIYRTLRKDFIKRFAEKHPKLQMRWGRYAYCFPNYSLTYKLLKKILKG